MTEPQQSDVAKVNDLNNFHPNVQDIEGFIDTLPAVPTHTPRAFWDSLKIALGKLYIFDPKNNQWLTWADATVTNFASGVGTKSSGTGNETFTVGFRPKTLKITAYADIGQSFSIGTRNEGDTYNHMIHKYLSGGYLIGSSNNSSPYLAWTFNTDADHETRIEFVSFNEDGFTINWSVAGVPTYYMWECS